MFGDTPPAGNKVSGLFLVLANCPLGKMYKCNNIANLMSKQNFYKLIPYLMPNGQERPSQSGHLKLEE